jgi:hypothetical protein
MTQEQIALLEKALKSAQGGDYLYLLIVIFMFLSTAVGLIIKLKSHVFNVTITTEQVSELAEKIGEKVAKEVKEGITLTLEKAIKGNGVVRLKEQKKAEKEVGKKET